MTGNGLHAIRLVIAGALGAGLIGCGGSSYAPDIGKPDAKPDGRLDAGGDGYVPECKVQIIPVSPASFDGLAPGATAKLRVRGMVTGPPAPLFTWSWNVRLADGTSVAWVQPFGTDKGMIEFPLAVAGSYTINVALLADRAMSCLGEKTVLVTPVSPRLASFRVRVAPPVDSDPVQEQEIQIVGATPSGGNRLMLSAGTMIRFEARDPGTDKNVPAYVRITDPAQRTVVEARVTAAEPIVRLRLMAGSYDALVVPDGDYAPTLLRARRPAELAALMPLAVDRGTVVQGQVTDASGPVRGAKVVLRSGALPSTLGLTGPTGAFTLRAAAGTYGMTVTLDGVGVGAGQTLEMHVPPTPGIAVAAGTPGPALDFQMAAHPTADLSLTLVAHDNTNLTGGTRVVISSAAPLDGLASLKLGAEVRPATLKVRAEINPKADGSVLLPAMPRTRYSATVFPGDATAMDAVTTISNIDLTIDDQPLAPIPMQRKIRLSGKLLPGALAGGTPITAVDLIGDFPLAIPGSADDAGVWTLLVSPQRRYAMRAQPQPGQMLARSVFGPVAVQGTDQTVADQRMPAALLYAGTLVDHSSQGIAGALLQVFCLAGSVGCGDAETPIAETVTHTDGHFDLLLPDPGVN